MIASIGFARRFVRHGGGTVGAALLLAVVAMALLAPWLYPGDPLRIVAEPLLWPGVDPHRPLGTDGLGRDMAAMILHGARATLLIGLFSAATAAVIGVSVGALAGFYDGWIGRLSARAIELFQSIPGLVFTMALVAFLGTHLLWVVLAIGLVSWDSIARLTRAEFLRWRGRDFVLACRGMGMGDARLIFGEVLPNAIPPIVAVSTLSVATAILVESGLSFLGLGDPSVPTWGRLVGEGRTLIRTDWYVCALPGFAIVLTVFALSLVSDGINDALGGRTR